MQHTKKSVGAHSADSSRRSRSTETVEPEDSYDYDYDYEPRSSSGSGTVKYILLGLVLVLIVAVIVVLCVRCSGANSGGGSIAEGLSSTILIQDSYGEDVTGNVTIEAGTSAPTGAELGSSVLLNMTWSGKKSATYPLIMKITDPSFEDGGGLIVFHASNGQWEKEDTYIVDNHSITFLIEDLGSYAFVPYDKYGTDTPEPTNTTTPTPTASAKASTSPSPSATNSASPSPSATSKNNVVVTYSNNTVAPVSTKNNQGTPAPIQEDDDEDEGGDTPGGDEEETTVAASPEDATPSTVPSTQPETETDPVDES